MVFPGLGHSAPSGDKPPLPPADVFAGKKVLLLSSDVEESKSIRSHLQQHGLVTSAATDPNNAAFHSMAAAFDILVIDLNVGRATVFELVELLGSQMPIILMSGDPVTEEEKVFGLEMGALDFIEKPVGRCEFIARLRVCLRPARRDSRKRTYKVYSFEGWTLNTRLRTLRDKSGQAIRLTSSEYDVLLAFLERPGRALSRGEVLSETRLDSTEVFLRSVDVLIVRLRRKLRVDGIRGDLISTVRGEGYRFEGDVRARTVGY